MSLSDLRDWLVHLRLPFQLLLSPIFLWGLLLAGGGIDRALVLGFLSFHVFGYAGGTAFNSYYDRDVGPIGGLEHPPAIPRGLLPFSLAWQVVGFTFALAVGPTFAVIYAIMFLMSAAYSHPRTRLKGKPLAAVATVGLGQGILAYVGGWTCAGAEWAGLASSSGLLGLAASELITLGFYPLTEIYQIDEDLRRGDLTWAAWLGPVRSFVFAIVCLGLGGLAAVVLVGGRFDWVQGALLAAFLLAILAWIWQWSLGFGAAGVVRNFRTLMRLYAVTSLGFGAWIALHLVGVL